MISFLFLILSCCFFVSRCQVTDEIDVGDPGRLPVEENDTLPPEHVITTRDDTERKTTTEATTTTTADPPSTTLITATTQTAAASEPEVVTSLPDSRGRAGEEVVKSLKGKIDETNERLIHLLSEKESIIARLEETRTQMVSVRAQVQDQLYVMDRFMKNASSQSDSSRKSYQQSMDQKLEILSQRLETLIQDLRNESEHQILINNRIIVISLAVVCVPITFLLILILYLTLRRDKKIVKNDQRLALSEMNHLRRYNDY